MNLPQREHPQAVDEFDAAVRWYEDREPGIGLTFIERARQAMDMIAQWPDAIVILAYAHERRKPGYWLSRMNG